MTLDIALELDHGSVRLLRRAAGRRTELGALRLDDPMFDTRLAALRHGVCGEDVDVEVVLPSSLVLFLDVGEAGQDEVEARVAEETPCAIDDLVLGRSGGLAAAVERTTLEEARDFARAHGFRPAAFAAHPNDTDDVVVFRYEPLPPPPFRSHRIPAEPEVAGPEAMSAAGESADLPAEHPGAVVPDARAGLTAADMDMPAGEAPVAPHMPPASEPGPGETAADRTPAAPATPVAGEDALHTEVTWCTMRSRDSDEGAGEAGAGRNSPDDLPGMSSSATEAEAAEEARPLAPDIMPELPLAFRRSATDFPYDQAKARQSRATSPPDEPEERREANPAAPVARVSGQKARPARPALTAPKVAPPRSEAEAFTIFGARGDPAPRARGFTFLHAAAAALAAGVLFAAYELFQDDVTELDIVSLQEVAANAVDPLTQANGTTGGADASALAGEPEVELAALAPAAPAVPGSAQPEPPPANGDAAVVAPGSDLATPVALPEPIRLETPEPLPSPVLPARPDVAMPAALTPPPPAGTVFDMDERGLVRPTEEGVLTPKGILVHSGPPATLPPAAALGRTEDPPPSGEELAGAQDDAALLTAEAEPAATAPDLPRIRPPARPEDADAAPVVTALAAGDDTPRPAFRPDAVEQAIASAASADAAAGADAAAQGAPIQTAAVAAGIAATAPRAAEPPPPEPEGRANVAVQPSLPTRASVAERATIQNALRLNRVNLIGVYGTSSDRRALIRLPTGRYMKVKVGDRVDGGRVASIQNSGVEYVKGGRRFDLSLPDG